MDFYASGNSAGRRMDAEEQNVRLRQSVTGRVGFLVFAATATFVPGLPAQGQISSEPSTPNSYTHMSEDLRTSVNKIVVIAAQVPTNRQISGSYENPTAGLIGGIESGSRMGTISKEISSLPVNIPIPGLEIPGAIWGGLSGATKREIQELRDELTDELAQAGAQPLTNDGLALDVFWGVHDLPSLDPKLIALETAIPESTDAALYVSFAGIAIDVQGKEAIITTSAAATLRRMSDGTDVYQTVIAYQDRDTLDNWTENENALWRDYANYARHYLGREIAADLFDRIELRHELRPMATDTASRDRKDERQLISKSLSPTLAWELSLVGGDSYAAWNDKIDKSNIHYDLEVYDMHQLVYYEEQVREPRHTIDMELEPCQTYRWSVRPSYHVDNEIRFGEWMRFDEATGIHTAKGIVGRKASDAPAYIQDFALLEIACGRR